MNYNNKTLENITAAIFSKVIKEKMSYNDYNIVYYTYAFVIALMLFILLLTSYCSYEKEKSEEDIINKV